ncbi:putative aldolase-type TIM barrel [Lupinus albus]|uniref:Putative aldolase-type TIM barrel n=1 Tax=Lupinus albus TaxID=3870 RepID=A0A6A4QHR4_LUPAL|nr:putative aldolase-type TIM barrel [Lupinus albus]
MELGREYKARKWSKIKHLHDFNSDTILVFQIADAHVFSTVSRFLFFAIVFVTLLFLGSILKGFSSSSHPVVFTGFGDSAFESINADALNLVLNDLKEEGLVKKEDKALIMSPPRGFEGVALLNNEVDVVKDSDLKIKNPKPDESYDFVFMPSFEDAKFADRILKANGILAFPLSTNPSDANFRKPTDYKVVYIRRHGSIIVALRKLGLTNKLADSSPKRKLLAAGAKTVALKVFLGIGLPEENKAAIKWFQRNYPKKNTKFEIHSHIVAPENPVLPHTDVSAWLSKHVKEEEYVVMKAEADVVEDMIRKKTTHLVDELFLECNNDWWQTSEIKKSGRAYWECLALYGKLRDEGVAVHQWWGNEADMALN